MTQEQEKLYEFLDQLKSWHENLESAAKEFEASARLIEKKKGRKAGFRQAVEKYSEAYAIKQVFYKFEDKFDLGFKEVSTSKVESGTLPGVFYDVITLQNLRGETKFQLKLKGEFCCHPNKEFSETGILSFEQKGKIKNLVEIADCDPLNINLVGNAMRAAGFDGDFEKPFRSCGVDKGDVDAYALALKMKVSETSHILGVDEFK
jgi:hypothetical protein